MRAPKPSCTLLTLAQLLPAPVLPVTNVSGRKSDPIFPARILTRVNRTGFVDRNRRIDLRGCRRLPQDRLGCSGGHILWPVLELLLR